MSRLDERLKRTLDAEQAPNLWTSILGGSPRREDTMSESRTAHVATVLVSLLIGAGALALAFWAFGGLRNAGTSAAGQPRIPPGIRQDVALYTSTTKVLVKPVGANSYLAQPTKIDLNVEAEIAKSDAVALRVQDTLVDTLGASEIETADLRGGLGVRTEPDTWSLFFDYTDPYPPRAMLLSAAFADAYIQERNQAAADLAEQQFQPQADELDKLAKVIPRLEQRISRMTTDNTNWARLNALLSNAYSRKSYLQQQILPYKAYVVDGGEILQEAVLPTSPSYVP